MLIWGSDRIKTFSSSLTCKPARSHFYTKRVGSARSCVFLPVCGIGGGRFACPVGTIKHHKPVVAAQNSLGKGWQRDAHAGRLTLALAWTKHACTLAFTVAPGKRPRHTRRPIEDQVSAVEPRSASFPTPYVHVVIPDRLLKACVSPRR